MFRYSLIALSTLVFMSCASVDEFLEVPLGKEPIVMFKNHLSRSENNSILLIGIDDPDIMTGLQYKTLEFYLHNTNKDLKIVNKNNSDTLNYLHFEIVQGEKLARLVFNFKELAEMTVFAIYLENMSANGTELMKYKKLSNGRYKNIKPRNARELTNKEIYFINVDVNPEQSGYFETLITNIFSLSGYS